MIIQRNAPGQFREQYQWILLAMCMIQADIQGGRRFSTNAFSSVRGTAMHFKNFEVVDGYFERIVPYDLGEDFGVPCALAVKGAQKTTARRYQKMHHSWLAWKADKKFIIDVSPLGGLMGCSPPVAHTQDVADVIYLEAPLHPETNLAMVERDAQVFYSLVEEAMKKIKTQYEGPVTR